MSINMSTFEHAFDKNLQIILYCYLFIPYYETEAQGILITKKTRRLFNPMIF